MIGLGCGARSYTRALHYCTEYAVSSGGVRDIIAKYLDGTDESFKRLDYGIVLTEGEQRRRFVIQSLLSEEGLSLAAYRRRFASEALDDIPMLAQLIGQGLANEREDKLELNEKGVERSDQIGPAFYSENVRRLMKDYVLR
jgi:oxygen-independent coproporphyrinogen-3 oxidase